MAARSYPDRVEFQFNVGICVTDRRSSKILISSLGKLTQILPTPTTPMNFQTAYDAYPANEHSIWLNNAGTTPAGSHIVTRLARHFEQLSTLGPERTDPGFAFVHERIKLNLSKLISADTTDFALIHNTAEGMTMLSLGLSLEPGDEILLLENEYPSNVYPWQIWEPKGVSLGFVPVGRDPELFLENVRARLTPRTRVLALSMVHWCTGMPLPFHEIAKMCHERGIFLMLDGSQGIGQIPIDFRAMTPAAVVFSAWKWLLGPLGLGVLVVDPLTVSRLSSPFRGTDSVTNPNSYLPYQTHQKQTADRYRYSTANTNDWVYFDESLEFLSSFGFPSVSKRILELTARLWGPLRAAGFTSGYDHGDQPKSGILCVEKPGVDMTEVATRLNEQGIVARVRLGRIRLAPHVYLSEEQIDRTVRLLVEAAR
jgi:cysteine desulfurase / selenocysteine lyase